MNPAGYRDLAASVARSADRLDRLGRIPGVPKPIVDHERALLERRCLRLLDAVRHADEPAWRWQIEATA